MGQTAGLARCATEALGMEAGGGKEGGRGLREGSRREEKGQKMRRDREEGESG